jgi:hypothetical protein
MTAHTPLRNRCFTNPFSAKKGSAPAPRIFNDAPERYKQIGDLAKKDVVAVPKSRVDPNQIFSLADAYGNHRADVVKKIGAAGQIVFRQESEILPEQSWRTRLVRLDDLEVRREIVQHAHQLLELERIAAE